MTRVYFVRAGDKIKIGYANNVQIRVAALQVGCPVKMEILGTMAGGVTEERALHEMFAHLRCGGEWFKADSDLLSFIGHVTNFEGGAFRLRIHKVVLIAGEEIVAVDVENEFDCIDLYLWGDAVEVIKGSGGWNIPVDEIRSIYFKP